MRVVRYSVTAEQNFLALLQQGADKFGVGVAAEKRRLLIDCVNDYLTSIHIMACARAVSRSCIIRSNIPPSQSFTSTTTRNFGSSSSCTSARIDNNWT